MLIGTPPRLAAPFPFHTLTSVGESGIGYITDAFGGRHAYSLNDPGTEGFLNWMTGPGKRYNGVRDNIAFQFLTSIQQVPNLPWDVYVLPAVDIGRLVSSGGRPDPASPVFGRLKELQRGGGILRPGFERDYLTTTTPWAMMFMLPAAGIEANFGRPGIIQDGIIWDKKLIGIGQRAIGEAPNQVLPGVKVLDGLHLDDLGRLHPWRAHYDQFGRLIARTDWDPRDLPGIPFVHHHTYQWTRGGRIETGAHIPGEYLP